MIILHGDGKQGPHRPLAESEIEIIWQKASMGTIGHPQAA
jgi:hypothetical protein